MTNMCNPPPLLQFLAVLSIAFYASLFMLTLLETQIHLLVTVDKFVQKYLCTNCRDTSNFT